MKISGPLSILGAAVVMLVVGVGGALERPVSAWGDAVVQQKAPPKGKEPTAQEKAQENYRMVCQPCHGPGGKSPLPDMNLVGREWKHGTSSEAIAKVISEGVPGTAMLPNKQRFTRAEILELARLVRSFDPKLKPEAKK